MRIVVELDNKWLSIEIGDIDPEADTDETVSATEAEVVRLPIGFRAPPDAIEEKEHDEDEPDDEPSEDDGR